MDISTDHARALQQVHTHRDVSRPLQHPPPNLLPNTSGHKTQELFISENCVLWFHNIHLTKTSSTFSVTSEIPEENKTDTIEEDQQKEHEGTSQSFCSASCFSVLIREYGFISVCFCIYTGLSTYGCQLQSLSLRGC